MKVLLADPSEQREDIENFLKENRVEVKSVHVGQEAQLAIYRDKFQAVIIHYDLEKHSALDVLRYIRSTKPSTRVILLFSGQDQLDDLGLSQTELKNLGASDILCHPILPKKVLESIEGSNQFAAWKKVLKGGEVKEEEVVDASDEEFTRIKIDDLYGGNTNIFDHYIRLGRNRFIKILHRGDLFDKDRIDFYRNEKRVKYLYFKTSDRGTYINYMNQLMTKIIDKKKGRGKTRLTIGQNVIEKFVDEIYTSGLKPQLLEEGTQICENMLGMIDKTPRLSSLFNEYQDLVDDGPTHIFLVSLLSTVICKSLNWKSLRTIEKVAFGSFLHDLGKLKFPPEMVSKRYQDLDEHQKKIYEKHPEYGLEMVKNIAGVDDSVKQIILQHHEYVNGEGYPHGIAGMKIFPLAKVVSLANEFTHLMMAKKQPPNVVMVEFLKNKEQLERFDPSFIKALVSSFTGKAHGIQ